MTKKEAVEILKNHNKWRKGEDVQPYSHSVLSEAIDTVTEAIVSNQSHTADVTDEEISEAAKLCIKDTEGDIIVDDMIDKVFYFNSGAKWALSRMPDEGWVKCSERLPELNKPVEVWCKLYGRFVATYEDIGAGKEYGNWRDSTGQLGILPPTHWRELHKSPTT